MKKWLFILILAGLVACGIYFFRDVIMTSLFSLNWITIISVGVFFSGSIYAIVERNFIVGCVSFGAALVLPWVKSWIVAYWPWVKAYYFH